MLALTIILSRNSLSSILSPKIAVEPLAFRVVWKSLNWEELPENTNKYGEETMSWVDNWFIDYKVHVQPQPFGTLRSKKRYNKVTTRWEGPQSLSYHKQWLSKMGYCIFKLVQANSHTQQEYELIVLFRNWDTISRFGTSMCWTPITALTPS